MVEHLADNGAVRKTSYVFVCLSVCLSVVPPAVAVASPV